MEVLWNIGGWIFRNEWVSFFVGYVIDGDVIFVIVGFIWIFDGRCIYDNFILSCFYRYVLLNIFFGFRSSLLLFLKERFLEIYVFEYVMDFVSLFWYVG